MPRKGCSKIGIDFVKAHWEDILEIYHTYTVVKENEERRELMSPGCGEITMGG